MPGHFIEEILYIEIMYKVSSSNDSNSTVRFYFFLHSNQVIEKLRLHSNVLKFFCNFFPKFSPYTYYANTNFKRNINTCSQKEYVHVDIWVVVVSEGLIRSPLCSQS